MSAIAANRHVLERRWWRRTSSVSLTGMVSLGLASWAPPAAAMEPANGDATRPDVAAMSPEAAATPSRRVVFETTGRSAWLEREEPAWIDARLRLAWRPICASPCSIDVPATGLYRVSGPGVRSSCGFRLIDQPNAIYVHANLGSPGVWTTGLVGIIVGPVFVFSAAMLFRDDPQCETGAIPDCKASRRTAAIVSLTLGAVMTVGGLYLLLSSGTEVSLTAPRVARKVGPFRGLTFSPDGVAF